MAVTVMLYGVSGCRFCSMALFLLPGVTACGDVRCYLVSDVQMKTCKDQTFLPSEVKVKASLSRPVDMNKGFFPFFPDNVSAGATNVFFKCDQFHVNWWAFPAVTLMNNDVSTWYNCYLSFTAITFYCYLTFILHFISLFYMTLHGEKENDPHHLVTLAKK